MEIQPVNTQCHTRHWFIVVRRYLSFFNLQNLLILPTKFSLQRQHLLALLVEHLA